MKSHEEILDLFQEIENIEKNIIEPKNNEDTLIEPQINIPKEPPKQIQEKAEKAIEKSLSKRHKKEKIKKPKKKKHILKHKKSIDNKFINTESNELTDESIKSEIRTKKIQSTFNLRLDNQGNLIGLNVKKPKEKIKIKQLIGGLVKRKTSEKNAESSDTKLKDIKGISVKIKSLPKVIKSKIPIIRRNEEGKGFDISGIFVKIKGIFSRK